MEINFISAEDIDLLILYLSCNVKKSNVYLFKDRTQTSILSFSIVWLQDKYKQYFPQLEKTEKKTKS
jgi:hypothetical protein